MQDIHAKCYLYFVSSSISTLVFIGINLFVFSIDYYLLGNSTPRSFIGYGNFFGFANLIESILIVVMYSVPFIYVTSLITYISYYVFKHTIKSWSYKVHILLFSLLFAFLWSKVFFEKNTLNFIFIIILISGLAFLIGNYIKPSKIGNILIVIPGFLLIGSLIVPSFLV